MKKPRVKVKINKPALGRAVRGIERVAQDAYGEVIASHAGRDRESVRRALKAATDRRGIDMDWTDDAVDAIADAPQQGS